MKHILLIIFLIALYIGEDNGQFISGVRGEVGSDIKIKCDVMSYISRASLQGFNPDKVLYSIYLGSDNLNFYHECFHRVDSNPRNNYTKSLISYGVKF